jgi:hypothetical protein
LLGMDHIALARQRLEQKFKATIDRDVSLVASDYCNAEGLVEASTLCLNSHEAISTQLWSRFVFDWSKVRENPGGTSGRMSAFVDAKLETTIAWAVATGRKTLEVRTAENATLEALQLLWLEWAGYMVTTSDKFAAALLS